MDDRIALRLGALRLARRRGRTREAAWAASRLRLDGVTLAPSDARFARDVRVKLGRALRAARLYRPRPSIAAATLPLQEDAPRSRRRRLIAIAIAAALMLVALLVYVRVEEPSGSPEGASPSSVAVIATPPPPLRGRTQPGLAVAIPVVVATPAPAEAPASAAPGGSGTGNAGGGTGAGGSGGGTGAGNGRGTPAPTVKPTPTVTPVPTPNPYAFHVTGRIVDAVTGQGLPDVCISIGSRACSLSPHTNPDGTFDVILDSQSGSVWSFQFIKAGYVTYTQMVPSTRFDMGTRALQRSQ